MFCSPSLHPALISSLVTVIRETSGVSPAIREQRLRERLDAAGLGASLGEMSIVVERATRARASDEELGLALGLVIALSQRSAAGPTP